MISVIIGVYNAEKYISKCLDSILNQTYTDFEIICIDDGSKDKSAEICEQYAEKYKNITFKKQENAGVAVVLNNALKIAKGEYVCFFDCDDFIHPDLFEVAMKTFEKNDIDYVAYGHKKIARTNNLNYKRISIENVKLLNINNPLNDFLNKKPKKMPLALWSRMFKRESIGDLRFKPGIYCEDLVFIPQYLSKVNKGIYIDFDFYYYFVNTDSISRTNINESKAQNLIDAVKILDNALGNTEYAEIIKNKAINNTMRILMTHAEDLDDTKDFLSKFKPQIKDLYNRKVFNLKGMSLSRKLKFIRLLK